MPNRNARDCWPLAFRGTPPLDGHIHENAAGAHKAFHATALTLRMSGNQNHLSWRSLRRVAPSVLERISSVFTSRPGPDDWREYLAKKKEYRGAQGHVAR